MINCQSPEFDDNVTQKLLVSSGNGKGTHSKAIAAFTAVGDALTRRGDCLNLVNDYNDKLRVVSSKTLHFVERANDELPAFAKVLAEHCIGIDLDQRSLWKGVSQSDTELLSKRATECAFATPRRPMQEADLVPVECCKIQSGFAHHSDHADEVSKKARRQTVVEHKRVPIVFQHHVWQRDDASLCTLVVAISLDASAIAFVIFEA